MDIEKVEHELYQLKKNEQTLGTFKITEVMNGVGRLEQLQVSGKVSPIRILEIFEVIQSYVKEEKFTELQVESHSETLDELLYHQQFHLQDVEKKLWIYTVDHK